MDGGLTVEKKLSTGVVWKGPYGRAQFVRTLLDNSILLQHGSVYFSEYYLTVGLPPFNRSPTVNALFCGLPRVQAVT